MTRDRAVLLIRWIWIVLFVMVVGVEGFTIGFPAVGDTLSENVWIIRSLLAGRVMVGALFAWLFWHFVMDRKRKYGAGDWLAILAGALIAVIAGPREKGPGLPK